MLYKYCRHASRVKQRADAKHVGLVVNLVTDRQNGMRGGSAWLHAKQKLSETLQTQKLSNT